MIVNITKPSCYDTKRMVKQGELLISKESDFGLTEGRVYVATKNQGVDTFHDCVSLVNDHGEELDYSTEYVCHYEGELVTKN